MDSIFGFEFDGSRVWEICPLLPFASVEVPHKGGLGREAPGTEGTSRWFFRMNVTDMTMKVEHARELLIAV